MESSHLNTEVTTINIVSKEQIARLSRVATNFKQFHKIVVLAMDITTDRNGRIHLQEIGFLAQHFCSLLENPHGLIMRKSSFTVEVLFQEC